MFVKFLCLDTCEFTIRFRTFAFHLTFSTCPAWIFGMDTSTSEFYIAVTGGKPNGDGYWLPVELLYIGQTEWQAGKYQQFH